MKLLQAILIIAGVYLAVRLIVRVYGKSILKWAGRKAMQRVQKQFEQRQNSTSTAEESILNKRFRAKNNEPSNSKKTVGEYVDYEEID